MTFRKERLAVASWILHWNYNKKQEWLTTKVIVNTESQKFNCRFLMGTYFTFCSWIAAWIGRQLVSWCSCQLNPIVIILSLYAMNLMRRSLLPAIDWMIPLRMFFCSFTLFSPFNKVSTFRIVLLFSNTQWTFHSITDFVCKPMRRTEFLPIKLHEAIHGQ